MSTSTAPHRWQAPWTLELFTVAIFIHHQEALETTIFSNKRTDASKPSIGNYPAITGSASVPKTRQISSSHIHCLNEMGDRGTVSVMALLRKAPLDTTEIKAAIARKQHLSPQLPKLGKAAVGQEQQSWKENTRVENQIQRLSAQTWRILKDVPCDEKNLAVIIIK